MNVSLLVVEGVIPESLIRKRFGPVGAAMVTLRRKGPVYQPPTHWCFDPPASLIFFDFHGR